MTQILTMCPNVPVSCPAYRSASTDATLCGMIRQFSAKGTGNWTVNKMDFTYIGVRSMPYGTIPNENHACVAYFVTNTPVLG